MGVCAAFKSDKMPARTKAQKLARLEEARREESVLHQAYALVNRQADGHWQDYLDAKEHRRRLEKELA